MDDLTKHRPEIMPSSSSKAAAAGRLRIIRSARDRRRERLALFSCLVINQKEKLAASAGAAAGEETRQEARNASGDDDGPPAVVGAKALPTTVRALLREPAVLLGEGTAGSTYSLRGGRLVLKRLRGVRWDGTAEFERLVAAAIAPVVVEDDRHVVALRAYHYSPTENEALLLYDGFPMGISLWTMLHGPRRYYDDDDYCYRAPLDWETRLAIAHDTARGVGSIHRARIYHGNIKSSNILLTVTGGGDYMALVSEHGLPALIGPNSRSLSNQAYHAPEVKDSIGNNGQKADVYSFGVVLLELLTGKNPACNDGVDLSRWVRSFAYTEWMATVVDTDLIGKQPVRKGRKMDAILDLLKLAMDCCITDADLRPDMNKVERLITQIRRS